MFNNKLIINNIESKIHTIRNKQVILDNDLAELYEIPTKRLNEQVKRNKLRFPEEFMFQLTNLEVSILRSQIATTNLQWTKKRTNPYVFTEHGVTILFDILKK